MSQKFSIKKRLYSFIHAINGIKFMLVEEHNFRIHLMMAFIAIFLSILLKIEKWEWIAVIFSIGLVFSLEIINSSIENICDFISIEKHIQIKKIKDLAAAAVLICATVTLIIGLYIFVPKFAQFF